MHDFIHFIEICIDFEYSLSCILMKGLVIGRKKFWSKTVFIGLDPKAFSSDFTETQPVKVNTLSTFA